MDPYRSALRWSVIICLPLLCAYEACDIACSKAATEVVGTYTSPNGRWQAVLMSCDAGAMDGFSTQVSVLPTAAGISHRLALCGKGNPFVADDNHGAVPVGDRGQIAVTVAWTSPTSLAVSYPDGARVFERDSSTYGIQLEYTAAAGGGKPAADGTLH